MIEDIYIFLNEKGTINIENYDALMGIDQLDYHKVRNVEFETKNLQDAMLIITALKSLKNLKLDLSFTLF